jgi:hypothetical protein
MVRIDGQPSGASSTHLFPQYQVRVSGKEIIVFLVLDKILLKGTRYFRRTFDK